MYFARKSTAFLLKEGLIIWNAPSYSKFIRSKLLPHSTIAD